MNNNNNSNDDEKIYAHMYAVEPFVMNTTKHTKKAIESDNVNLIVLFVALPIAFPMLEKNTTE